MIDKRIESFAGKPILKIANISNLPSEDSLEGNVTIELHINNKIESNFQEDLLSITRRYDQIIIKIDQKYFDYNALKFINDHFLLLNAKNKTDTVVLTLFKVKEMTKSIVKNNHKIFDSIYLGPALDNVLLLYSLNENIRLSKNNQKLINKITLETKQLKTTLDQIQDILDI